jgi:starch phosphorylase
MKVLSLVEESDPKMVKMANLCIISSHKINGVSQVHTKIIQNKVFKDFYEMAPKKFINITNGCSPRRFYTLNLDG